MKLRDYHIVGLLLSSSQVNIHLQKIEEEWLHGLLLYLILACDNMLLIFCFG